MDLEYLRRRQDEERARAASAECDVARRAHEQLAEFFGREIDKASAWEGDLPVAAQQAQAG